MRIFFLFISLFITFQSFSQKKVISKIRFSSDMVLTGVIEKFDSSKHTWNTCAIGTADKYICRIDGKPWFGSDLGYELPRNELTRLTIKIRKIEIPLNATRIFNPVNGNELRNEQFKLKKQGSGYILYSFFSDGAGSYTVYWKINDGKSSRIKFSNDERYFQWQFDK